jgi:hypothetical protein
MARCTRLPLAARGIGIGLFAAIALALSPLLLAVQPAYGQALVEEQDLEDEEVAEASEPLAAAQFTTAVENREPIDQVTFVSTEVQKIFFFSELRGLAGRRITHRWLYAGETMAEVSFDVEGPRWRVWSSKDLLPDWLGDWTVEILTDDGEVIAAETFTYTAPEV